MAPINPQPDTERNRLLRRADWRFLLPTGQPRRSICFATGLLAEAVAEISEHTTDGCGATLPEAGKYDLAVVVNPDGAALQKAWHALQPGGICYAEWTRPLPGGAAEVRRRLAAAGFGAPACYWPTPHPDRSPAAIWLPLEGAGALHYHRANRCVGVPARQQAAYRLKWSLWQAAQRAGFALPICSFAARPADPSDPASLGCDHDHLLADWQALGLGQPPTHISRLLLTGGMYSVNKAVMLVFAGAERRPRAAVKMARVPESLPALAHEAEVLHTLHAQGQVSARSAPQTLFFDPAGPVPRLGQSALSGAPLWAILRRSNYACLAEQATAWQIELAHNPPPVARTLWWNRLVQPRLDWFTQFYAGIADEQQLRRTQEMLQQLGDLPLVCEQRDFSPWNLQIDGDQLVVLDWESAELHGLPAVDLIYFLTYLTLFVEGVPVHGEVDMGRVRAVHGAALDPRTENGRVVESCLRRYCEAVGLDPAYLRPLRLLTWLMTAHQRHLARGASSGVAVPEQIWRHSIFVQLWQEELLHESEAV